MHRFQSIHHQREFQKLKKQNKLAKYKQDKAFGVTRLQLVNNLTIGGVFKKKKENQQSSSLEYGPTTATTITTTTTNLLEKNSKSKCDKFLQLGIPTQIRKKSSYIANQLHRVSQYFPQAPKLLDGLTIGIQQNEGEQMDSSDDDYCENQYQNFPKENKKVGVNNYQKRFQSKAQNNFFNKKSKKNYYSNDNFQTNGKIKLFPFFSITDLASSDQSKFNSTGRISDDLKRLEQKMNQSSSNFYTSNKSNKSLRSHRRLNEFVNKNFSDIETVALSNKKSSNNVRSMDYKLNSPISFDQRENLPNYNLLKRSFKRDTYFQSLIGQQNEVQKQPTHKMFKNRVHSVSLSQGKKFISNRNVIRQQKSQQQQNQNYLFNFKDSSGFIRVRNSIVNFPQ